MAYAQSRLCFIFIEYTVAQLEKELEFRLISKVLAKDPHAFDQLVEEYKGMVFNTTLNFLAIKEDAEEVTQDVFVEVYNSLKSFRLGARLKTWIYRITVTKCLEFMRRQRRKKRFGYLLSIGSVPQEQLADTSFNHPGVDEASKTRATMVHNLVHELPENQKIAFTMHHMDGLSYREVAEIMDTSLGAVESLIFRAKRSLKKTIMQTQTK